jgi:phosphate transport system substrate-binding protein
MLISHHLKLIKIVWFIEITALIGLILVVDPKGTESLILNRSRFGGLKSLKLTGKRATALVAVAAVVPAVALPASASANTVLIGSGSSAAQPYMLALFNAYHKLHKNITFKFNPDGGNAGVKDVQNGIAQFAIQTANPVPSNVGTTFTKLFLDGMCLDVNSSNSLTNITMAQLAGIYSQPATYTSWSQVGGNLGSDAIVTEGRNSSAGQFTFFQSEVLNGGKENSSTTQLTSDGLVKTSIEQSKDAIGYVGLANSGAKGETKAKGEKPLSINGIACDAATVKTKTYPLWRYDWGVLPAKGPNPAVQAFFKWAQTSEAAGKVINAAGAVAAFNKK